MTRKFVFSLCCLLGLNACSTIDDYMLGTDNTPKPSVIEKKYSKQATLKKRWQERTTTTAVSDNLYHLTPTVKEGVIYTANANGSIQARTKDSGQLIWRQDIKLPIASGPNVGKNLVVVGAQAKVVALSKKTGDVLWKSEVSNQLLAPPTLSEKIVFAKTIDGQVYAFNALDGTRQWHYTHGSPELILRASGAPVVAGHLVLLGFSDGKLDAVDARTGRLVWQRNVSYAKGQTEVERLVDIDATPIVKDNVAYLASYQGNVTALSLSNGQILWKQKVSAYKDMALDKNTLFVVDDNSHVWAMNCHSGMVLWHQKELHNRHINAPAVSKQGLVLTDGYGYLHLLSPLTGEVIMHAPLENAKTEATPIIDEQDVYILFKNGLLTDYSLVS